MASNDDFSITALTARIEAITARTGYAHEVTPGQRKYGPPADWTGPPPGPGTEIYCGKLPKTVYEDELIPVFEQYGKIYDLRLMMDPQMGQNKGFCFCMYSDKSEAEHAAKELDGYEIRPNKKVKVNISKPNCRIFVGNIPKSKDKDEIFNEFSGLTEGVVDVIIYNQADNPKKKNRGFCFLDFDTHKNATEARKKLLSHKVRPFNSDCFAEWAEPLQEVDEETMSKVKILYVRNLTEAVTEKLMRETFSPYGELEKVKRIKDFGFVHFKEREDALKAMEALNGTMLEDAELLVTLAKPPNNDNRSRDSRGYGSGGYGSSGSRSSRGHGSSRGQGMMSMFGQARRLAMLGGGLGGGMSILGGLAAAAALEADYYGYDDYSGYYDDYSDDYGYYGGGSGGGRRGGRGGRGRGSAALAALKGSGQPGVSVLGSITKGSRAAAGDLETGGILKVIARGKLSDLGAAGLASRGRGVKRLAISELNELYGKTPRAEAAGSEQASGVEGSYGGAEGYGYSAGGGGESEWYQDTFTGTQQWG